MNDADAFSTFPLATHDENKVLELSFEGDERDAVFRYLRFGVKASGSRIAASGSLMIADVHLVEFAQEVKKGNQSILYDIDGEASISIEPIDLGGHFKISIWLGNIESDRAWITFETDQTAVMPFVKNLERIALAER